MTEEGITKAMEYEDITVRELEKLKQKYPINTEERRGRRKNPLTQLERVSDNQEAITIESNEVKEVTQESIARDILSLAKQINREVWNDQQIISILKEAQSELWNIAHIAAQPVKELTTNKQTNHPTNKYMNHSLTERQFHINTTSAFGLKERLLSLLTDRSQRTKGDTITLMHKRCFKSGSLNLNKCIF